MNYEESRAYIRAAELKRELFWDWKYERTDEAAWRSPG